MMGFAFGVSLFVALSMLHTQKALFYEKETGDLQLQCVEIEHLIATKQTCNIPSDFKFMEI